MKYIATGILEIVVIIGVITLFFGIMYLLYILDEHIKRLKVWSKIKEVASNVGAVLVIIIILFATGVVLAGVYLDMYRWLWGV